MISDDTLLIQCYIDAGLPLCAIKKGEKAPFGNNWNSPENVLKQPPSEGVGVGLVHAVASTMALDIDDYKAARTWLAERGVNLDQLFQQDTALVISRNVENRAKLIYRLFMPLQTKQVVIDGKVVMEFRCASESGSSMQDILPPSTHPDGTRYQWVKGDWRDIPPIPEQLLKLWGELQAPKHTPAPEPAKTELPSAEEVWKMLLCIDPDCSRYEWMRIGMALKVSGFPFEMWNEWSKKGKKYEPTKIMGQWNSFKNNKNTSIVRFGTLFHYALKAGYQPPAPDWEKLFGRSTNEGYLSVDDLGKVKGGLPPCDPDLFPKQLTDYALEVSNSVGADPAISIVAGLAAVSGVADHRIQLEISDTFEVPPTAWFMAVGDPSTKKTPASKPMFALLQKLEIEDRPRYEAAKLGYETAEARLAKWTKEQRDDPNNQFENQQNEPPPMPPLPVMKRLILNDITTAKTANVLRDRPEGVLYIHDEMSRFFNGLINKNSSEDRGIWIAGYECSYYHVDRVGTGSFTVENMGISMYGNCQPEVLYPIASQLAIDGTIQRFLPIVTNPHLTRVPSFQQIPEFMSCKTDYETMLRRIHTKGETVYRLSHEARQLFHNFMMRSLKEAQNAELLNLSKIYSTAAGKANGNCARLVLLCHLMIDVDNPVVSESTVQMGINIYEQYFLPMMNYLYNDMMETESTLHEWLIDMLIQRASVEDKEIISSAILRNDIGRKKEFESMTPAQFDDQIEVLMMMLEKREFVVKIKDDHRYSQWAINPAIATVHKERREKIIEVKAERQRAMAEKIIARGLKPNLSKITGT